MTLTEETTVFLVFVVMGMLFSIIFDFFRARKEYMVEKNVVSDLAF